MSHAIEQTADAILELINAKPASPTKAEIAAVIARSAMPDERVGVPADGAPFQRIHGPDGKLLEFNGTNISFCNDYLPWVRMAFALISYDQPSAQRVMRDLWQGGDGEELVDNVLHNLQEVYQKFSAIGAIAEAALARAMIAGNAIAIQEQNARRAVQ